MGRLPFFLVIALTGACTASAVEVAPPRYDLYFPTGLGVSPDERYLFVVNANSDLRYSHGTLQVYDLDQIDALTAAWNGGFGGQLGPDCTPVPARPKVMGCPTTLGSGDPSPALVAGAVVGIGSFGVDVGAQRLDQEGMLRLFTTVRGDPSVTWMDFDTRAAKISCGEAGGFPRCDEAHRMARRRNDATLPPIPVEPFNLYVDEMGQHVFVTHFTSGFVTLISAPQDGREPMIQDSIVTLFAPNRLNGTLGAAGVAARAPGDPTGLVYITSTREARVATVAVADGPLDDKGRKTEALVRSGSFFIEGLEQSSVEGDVRSISFSPSGDRAYVVSRVPPSLQIFDTSLNPQGRPRNQWLGSVEICSQPANLAVADFGEGPRVATPCFTNGQVWIIDPVSLRLMAVEDSGRGPNGIAASAKHKKIYVGNYAEDTLTVIDTAPGSISQNRAVLRLGSPRLVELK